MYGVLIKKEEKCVNGKKKITSDLSRYYIQHFLFVYRIHG